MLKLNCIWNIQHILFKKSHLKCRLQNTAHVARPRYVNTLKPSQNGYLFADDILKRFFVNENLWISFTISLKFVPKFRINNIPALGQIMAWRRPGDKPLSELMMVSLLTHICVTRPQWVMWISYASQYPLVTIFTHPLITIHISI